MTASKKKDILLGTFAFLLIFLAVAARMITLGHRNAPYFLPLSLLRSFLYIVLMLGWGAFVWQRIIQTQVRRYLTAIFLLCVFWLSLRTIKYFFVSTPDAVRHLWYGYYFPMLFIPPLSVFVALSLGKPEDYRLPRCIFFLYFPAALLFLLVWTNDFHQLIFVFPPDTSVWTDTNHTYGPGYFAVMGFIVLAMAAAIFIMLCKCRIPCSRQVLLLPFVPVLLAVLYTIFYVAGFGWLRDLAGDMTVVQCLLLAIGMECCIRCSLIQSNTGYEALFEASGIRAEITDANLQVCAASAPLALFPKEKLQEALCEPTMLDHNTILKSSPIHNGYVFWQEDISELQDALDRLRFVQEELRDTGDILKEENAQKARMLKLQEQARLYDLIEQQSARQFARLEELLDELQNTASLDGTKPLLGRIAVLMPYVKRRSNLVFLTSRKHTIETDELQLCLNESVQALQLCSILCAIQFEGKGELPALQAIAIYDLFGAVLDTGRSLSSLLFFFKWENDVPTVRISAACIENLTVLSLLFPGLLVKQDDDDIWHLSWHLQEVTDHE